MKRRRSTAPKLHIQHGFRQGVSLCGLNDPPGGLSTSLPVSCKSCAMIFAHLRYTEQQMAKKLLGLTEAERGTPA